MPYKIKRFTTRFRTARDSGLHRIAVFALYRAILKTCTKVALPENLVSKRGPVNPLVFLVRKGFRRNRGIDHAVLVGRAMGVGHVVCFPCLRSESAIMRGRTKADGRTAGI